MDGEVNFISGEQVTYFVRCIVMDRQRMKWCSSMDGQVNFISGERVTSFVRCIVMERQRMK